MIHKTISINTFMIHLVKIYEEIKLLTICFNQMVWFLMLQLI